MSDQSKQAIAEEKHALSMKFFDYAETPIKEWISAHLQATQQDIFNEEKTEADILSVCAKGKYYRLYYTVFKDDVEEVAKDEYVSDEDIRKAMSMLYDAVRLVFPCVIASMQKYKDKLTDIVPKFNQNNLTYSFNMINQLKLNRALHMKNMQDIQVQMAKINQKLDNINKELNKKTKTPEDIEMLRNGNEIRDNLIITLNDEIKKVNAITEESIKERDAHCETINKELSTSIKLYLIVTKDKPDDDAIMKRLPKFGMEYQDPDEETFIDTLKKEYNVNE
jgi:hypothetical protein